MFLSLCYLRELVELKSSYIASISRDIKSLKIKLDEAIKSIGKDEDLKDSVMLKL